MIRNNFLQCNKTSDIIMCMVQISFGGALQLSMQSANSES